MSESVQPYRLPDAAPVGHTGTRVERVRNFETNRLKVNDADGNPVEIAAIVVWQVADTSKAVYAVDEYVDFVRVQAESALRHVATTRPYDDPAGDGTSLRGSTDVVAGELAQECGDQPPSPIVNTGTLYT